jgi:SAM-dependent methyltransferase
MQDDQTLLKNSIHDFWNEKSCGEVYATGATFKEQLEHQAAERYRLEPQLLGFAGFAGGAGKDVLEIGVGMGADHLEWARASPRSLVGIDVTERAIEFTAHRLELYGLSSNLRVADAENLPFAANSFDIVYSYGVLHVPPDTPKAVREVFRVLRPGGVAKVLIYHTWSMVGYMLWLRYGLLAFRPFRGLRDIYAQHLESPGTKAYTIGEARELFGQFRSVDIQIELGPGDLLEGEVGQRHRGLLLRTAKVLWPRWFIRRAMKKHGMSMFITAVK